MFILVTVLLLTTAGFVYKYRNLLTFANGRLKRSNKPQRKSTMGDDKFIELSFGTVHYIYTPSSTSHLNIFVHGFSIPMEIWQDVYESFVRDNQACLIFDLYGRGYSDAPDVPMNVDLFVSQLAELLYALDLPYEKYNLFGVSMGGVIVQRFTQLHPRKVSKLILCCPAGLNIKAPSKLIMSLLAIPIIGPTAFQLVMARGESKSVRDQWAYPGSDKYRTFMQLFRDACEQHPGYVRSLYSTVVNFDFRSYLNSTYQFNIPILIVWGDKDALIPVQNAYDYKKLYKDAVLSIVPGANHSLLIEHPNESIEAMKAFLKGN